MPSDIFFAGKGFKVGVSDEYNIPLPTVDEFGSNFRFLDRYKIEYINEKIKSETAARELLEKCILEEKMISVAVRSDLLTHSRVFKQTLGSVHYLNIIGMTDRSYIFFDGFVPEKKPNIFIGEIDAIKERNKESKELISNKNDIVIFNNMISSLKNAFNDVSNLKEIVQNVNFRLRIYGYISSKYYIAESFAAEGADTALIDNYLKLIDEWDKNCFIILKAGYSKKLSQINMLASGIEKVCISEHNILEQLL